jgi:hypothetical protein
MKRESYEEHMYYQTTLRNIALYTSVSFAALAYSRVYRSKNNFYNVSLIFVSILFLSISILLNYYLYLFGKSYTNKRIHENNDIDFNKYVKLNQIIFIIHGILLLLGIITLFKFI